MPVVFERDGEALHMVVRVDAQTRAVVMSLLAPDEKPSDFLRAAIQREITRRRSGRSAS